MAAEYQGQDPMVIAKQAERDLNSQKAPLSDSSKSSPPPKKSTTQTKTNSYPPSQPKSPA
jgi:hypothetical protein